MKTKLLPCSIALLAICAVAQASEDERKSEETSRTKVAAKEAEKPKTDAAPRSGTHGWDAAWFRLEGIGMTAWPSGSFDRTGDFGFRLTLDYEVPVVNHLTVSPRAIPFMYWDENNDGDNHIFAAGLGFSLRGYVRKDDYRGFYGEVGGMGIVQSDKFGDNGGWFNFIEEAGVGYVFKSDWSTSLKVGHMSNANLFEGNGGVNWASVGVGYSFRH